MKFHVEKEIFEKLPTACFGLVMAKGIDNRKAYPEIDRLLEDSIQAAARRFEGKKVKETPDTGEVIYVVGHQVRTRRWTWRQSEHGKITPSSTDIFFPIDGFADVNREQVLAARDELQALIQQIFGCEAAVGFVDAGHPEWEL